jgi:phospholipid/cholesterol/gamma-HCH transport system substrate-binding protein
MKAVRINALKLGAFSAVILLLLVVLANTMLNRVSGDTRTFQADFTNVSNLRPGDDVRAAGVRVGRVEKVELHGTKARVSFNVSEHQPVYTDTRLSVRYQNLLGQRYLAMLPGPGSVKRLVPGSVIPDERTDPGFDLTALLNGFEPLFTSLEPKQINQLSSSIVAVMQGQGGTVEALLRQTASLTEHLADKDEVLGRVLDNLTPVLVDLAGRGEQIDDTITNLRSLMTALAKERTSIGDSIDGIGELSEATASLVAEARKPLHHDVRAFREFGRISVVEMKRINELFANLPGATAAFARPMSHGTWLNMYICNAAVDANGKPLTLGPASGHYSAACSG